MAGDRGILAVGVDSSDTGEENPFLHRALARTSSPTERYEEKKKAAIVRRAQEEEVAAFLFCNLNCPFSASNMQTRVAVPGASRKKKSEKI